MQSRRTIPWSLVHYSSCTADLDVQKVVRLCDAEVVGCCVDFHFVDILLPSKPGATFVLALGSRPVARMTKKHIQSRARLKSVIAQNRVNEEYRSCSSLNVFNNLSSLLPSLILLSTMQFAQDRVVKDEALFWSGIPVCWNRARKNFPRASAHTMNSQVTTGPHAN